MNRKVVALAIVALFIGLVLGKVFSGRGPMASAPAPTGERAGATITSVHNDAVADYEAAIKTGKPVYVLFHSMTCQPCIEISEVVDRVLPEYEDRIVFVNAITDDPSAQRLAQRFEFQYIPTSFFLAPDGTVSNSFTGAMSEEQMRGYLDRLANDR